MTGAIVLMAWLAAAPEAPSATPGKLAPEVSKQMMASIIAVSKALGLESWPMRNVKPCVDRGGQGITAKDVTAEETRKCADTAIGSGFPELGKSFVLAIPMASIGPVTVLALGVGDSAGWAAYSCDPERKCLPVKIGGEAKWSKRMAERQAKACSEATTLWFPADKKSCPGP
ncbi:MAG TPA: hypothetical protein VMT03_05380 [Polyangia bacterium]|nr:hypothetical protein [Polyangia bacterium]